MMHLEEGEKHSFWAESLPAGLSVVRQFDKIVLAVWLLCMAGYCVAVALLNERTIMGHLITAQGLLACIALPFVAVGLLYIIDRRNIASLIINLTAVALSSLGVLTPISGALWHNFGSVFVVVNAAALLRIRDE